MNEVDKGLTIEELARRGGLSLRTLRYYIQEGLMPGPDTAGKYASYSQHHLDHITIIKRLKSLHLPLKEIRNLISNMTPRDMKRILQYQDTLYFQLGEEKVTKSPTKSPGELSSALEYIQDLEIRQSRLQSIANSPTILPRVQSEVKNQKDFTSIHEQGELKTQKESWSKIILREGVELNIRETEASRYKNEIEELAKFAGKLFGNY